MDHRRRHRHRRCCRLLWNDRESSLRGRRRYESVYKLAPTIYTLRLYVEYRYWIGPTSKQTTDAQGLSINLGYIEIMKRLKKIKELNTDTVIYEGTYILAERGDSLGLLNGIAPFLLPCECGYPSPRPTPD